MVLAKSMQLNDAPVAIATPVLRALAYLIPGRPVGKESPIPALPNEWPVHLKLTARYRIYAVSLSRCLCLVGCPD